MKNVSNNCVEIVGKVIKDLTLSHEIYDEKFYTTTVEIPRLSGVTDNIDVLIPGHLITDVPVTKDCTISVSGEYRSYNKYETDRTRLILFVFAKSISLADEGEDLQDPNKIFLNGFVCKTPVFRATPLGRDITDILIAVNRNFNKSDYIPTIAWGENARLAKTLEVGDNIRVWGRIQSRQYQKVISEDEVIEKTTYEVSITRIEKKEGEQL